MLAASVLAVALPANAAAWKAPTVTRMQLAVEVTGIHVFEGPLVRSPS